MLIPILVHFCQEQYVYSPIMDEVEKPEEGWQFEQYLIKQIEYYKPQKKSLNTCWVNEQTARISNVQNYTNFRQRAGLNQPVLGQISLGERVTLTNPGTYLRTDRCASICNESNQQLIKQCIDNNEVWIEVRYRGRVGYLSRKFVE